MLNCIIVGAGGALGAILRYLIGLIPINRSTVFPVNTFLINIIGSFATGIIAALALRNDKIDPKLVLFLKTGICGGFTTFSSFALETGDLIAGGNTAVAALYAALSMVMGVAAVFAGEWIIKCVASV